MTILKPYIHEQFKGQVWQFIIDADKALLFAEIRDAESREVSFAGIDLESGIANFKDLVPDEKWLTGMEGSYRGVLLLHGYQSTQSPVHKGITAVDGNNGSVLWSKYVDAVQSITINGPVIYNTQLQPKKLFVANEFNGSIIRPFNADTDTEINPDITVPNTIETLDNDVKQHVKGDIVGNIHYIEHNSFRIVSLHTLIKTDLSQVLLIMQGSNLVYEDLLMAQIQKLQPEAFILHGSKLIYIKNKIELKVLNL